MNSNTSTAPTVNPPLTFKGESEATLLVIDGNLIGAIKLLRERNPWIDLLTAKDIAERIKEGGERLTVAEIFTKRLAHFLAMEYYRGKLSDLDLEPRIEITMAEAAARENAERMFSGTAGELVNMILQAVKE